MYLQSRLVVALLVALFAFVINVRGFPDFRSGLRRLAWWKNDPPSEVQSQAITTLSICNADTVGAYVLYGSGGNDQIVDSLYTELVSCSRIRSLSLSIRQGGCVVDDTNPFSFTFKQGDRFPDLENLTLSGYDWDSFETARWRGSTPSSLEFWCKTMNWNTLKRLNIDRPPKSFFNAFSGTERLSGLESLVLRPLSGFWGDEETFCDLDESAAQLRHNYTAFVAGLPPLRELSISGMGVLLDMNPILETHGHSLVSLGIHEFERDCIYDGWNETSVRPTLNASQIQYISEATALLESMELDIHRSDEGWPTSTFAALSSFANLRKLTLYSDLEDPTRRRPVEHCFLNNPEYCFVPALAEPQLDQDAAEGIFREIRLLQNSQKLRHLTIYAGDWGRREGGGLRIADHYDHNRPAKFVCNAEESGLEICKKWNGYTTDESWFDGEDDDGWY